MRLHSGRRQLGWQRTASSSDEDPFCKSQRRGGRGTLHAIVDTRSSTRRRPSCATRRRPSAAGPRRWSSPPPCAGAVRAVCGWSAGEGAGGGDSTPRCDARVRGEGWPSGRGECVSARTGPTGSRARDDRVDVRCARPVSGPPETTVGGVEGAAGGATTPSTGPGSAPRARARPPSCAPSPAPRRRPSCPPPSSPS